MTENKKTDETIDNMEDLVVTLELDDDTEVECGVLSIFDIEDQDYIVLIPLNEDGSGNDDGEIYLYRYSEDTDGNPILENIESDEEYKLVADRFDEVLDEEMIEDDE